MALTDDLILAPFLQEIADAIRYSEDSTEKIYALTFPERIGKIKDDTYTKTVLPDVMETDYLGYIAEAIRHAEGSSEMIKVEDFVNRIRALKDQPSPIPPIEGTWQLKTTTPKKYVIMGTDDDNVGNVKYFRLLRSYGFPYTMNIEAENLTHDLGNDVDTSFFTDTDAPSLFPQNVNVTTFSKYLHDSGMGEVAQHGASANVLWDSAKLIGTYLDNVYQSYVEQGGTKTIDEFRLAIMEQLYDSDVQNDAPYVANARHIIENALGFNILTVGAWGGSPTAIVDGITINLNSIKGGYYDWQGHGYYGASTKVATWGINITSYDIARMNDGSKDMTEYIDLLPYGKAVEFFWHVPFNDRQNVRGLMESIKTRVDSGEVEVVTRYQYAQLGEYVANPIQSIKVTRDGNINQGEADDLSKYTTIVTYADGTQANVSDEALIDNSAVDINVENTYTVIANYRGFTANVTVTVVASGGGKYVDYTYYPGTMSKGAVTSDTGNGIYVFPVESGRTYYLTSTGGKGNHVVGYTAKAVPEKLDSLTDGAQIGSWSALNNKAVTVSAGCTYLYYYYSGGGEGSTTVTLAKEL